MVFRRCFIVVALLEGLVLCGMSLANGVGAFGRPWPDLLNLKGRLYFLPDTTTGMPNLVPLQPHGTVYTSALNVPPRPFETGFPDLTDRTEWFGIDYRGTFEAPTAGVYRWRLVSDDGSRLWIDGVEVIDNDGLDGVREAEGAIELGEGTHAIRVWYFQGPPGDVALQLFVTPPSGQERVFDLRDFSPRLLRTLERLGAEATSDGIRITLGADALFKKGRVDVHPKAMRTLDEIASVIAASLGCRVRIEGHTDASSGEEEASLLSQRWAHAVRDALARRAVEVPMEVVGFGGTLPVATNKTKEGRAKNRRIEIYIAP